MPDLARGEGVGLMIDLNGDVANVLPSFVPNLRVPYDFAIGIPAGQPASSSSSGDFLPCTVGKSGNELLNMANCFGVYDYQNTTAVNIARRFLRPTQLNGANWPVTIANPSVDANHPDLEFVIHQFSELRARAGVDSHARPWSMLVQVFTGSFLDAGIGEDYVPSQTDYVTATFASLGGSGISCTPPTPFTSHNNIYYYYFYYYNYSCYFFFDNHYFCYVFTCLAHIFHGK